MRNKILVIGDAKSGKKTIIQQIVGSESQHKERAVSGLSLEEYPWEIDNKYYSAKVYVWCLSSANLVPTPEQLEALSEEVEAFVVVHDQSQVEASVSALAAWLPYVSEHVPSISLCIASKDDLASEDPAPLRAWAEDALCEFVRVSATQEGEGCAQAPLSGQEGFDDEVGGIARVVEALTAHVWPSLVPKGSAKVPPPSTFELHKDPQVVDKIAKDIVGAFTPPSTEHMRRAEEEMAHPPGDSNVTTPSSDAPSKPEHAEALVCDNCGAGNAVSVCSRCRTARYCSKECQRGAWKAHKSDCKKRKVDVKSEDLLPPDPHAVEEKTFEEAFTQFQALKKEGADLPDEERREMAANVAMAFYNQLATTDDDEFDLKVLDSLLGSG